MRFKFTHTLEIEGTEMLLTVEAVYFPGTPGTREDPPEDESIEITSVINYQGQEVIEVLTDAEIETLEAAAMEQVTLAYEMAHPEF